MNRLKFSDGSAIDNLISMTSALIGPVAVIPDPEALPVVIYVSGMDTNNPGVTLVKKFTDDGYKK